MKKIIALIFLSSTIALQAMERDKAERRRALLAQSARITEEMHVGAKKMAQNVAELPKVDDVPSSSFSTLFKQYAPSAATALGIGCAITYVFFRKHVPAEVKVNGPIAQLLLKIGNTLVSWAQKASK